MLGTHVPFAGTLHLRWKPLVKYLEEIGCGWQNPLHGHPMIFDMD